MSSDAGTSSTPRHYPCAGLPERSEGDPKAATSADLAEMMVGRAVRFAVEPRTTAIGGPVLEVKGLTVLNERDEVAVAGIDLTVHAGEIVGRHLADRRQVAGREPEVADGEPASAQFLGLALHGLA